MRTSAEIGVELRTRECHLRQYLGVARFDVWADGKCYGSFASPVEAEACMRNLLRITPEEAVMLEEHVKRQQQQQPAATTGPEAN